MIGLVMKDILVLRKTLRSYALFLCFYAALAALGLFQIYMVTAMIQVLVMMLPIGAFSYDEWTKWDCYAISLPLGRRAVVGGRYLFTLLLALASSAFGLLTCVLLSILEGPTAMLENLATVLVSLGAGLFLADVLLPLCYKLGPERARPYLYALTLVPLIGFFGAHRLGLLDGLDLSWLDRAGDAAALGLASLLPLTALAGLGISFLISCRVMEGKEF